MPRRLLITVGDYDVGQTLAKIAGGVGSLRGRRRANSLEAAFQFIAAKLSLHQSGPSLSVSIQCGR